MSDAQYPEGTAAANNLKCCELCMHINPASAERCERCGDRIHFRRPYAIQKTIAFLITAMVFYIPANIYPVMINTVMGKTEYNTIIEGIVMFFEEGSYFVASVIFTASIFIPIAKIIIIFWLCYYSSKVSSMGQKELTIFYKITEFIGKWSMIDVFVVAILVALVQFANIMVVEPGIASRSFALVVILTMIAALQFDMRLVWDKQKQK